MTNYYKLLNEDGTTPQGYGKWHLPKTAGKPGQWMPPIKGKLAACENGYHVLKIENIIEWSGACLWEVEVKGAVVDAENKSLVRRARLIRMVEAWNHKNLRLFAADCAEHVLPLFEKNHRKDKRPRKAIEAARLFAHGKIRKEKLFAARAAAWAAAWAAAGAAARDAAWAAARAAAGDAARAAAWDAARDAAGAAAGDAAWDAAWAAARAAEREWQTACLKRYLFG